MTKAEVDKVVENLMLGRPTGVPIKWIDGVPGQATLEIDGERWNIKVEVLGDVVDGTCGFQTKVEPNKGA